MSSEQLVQVSFIYKMNSMILFFQDMEEFKKFKKNTFSKEKIPIEKVEALMTQYHIIMEILNDRLKEFFSKVERINLYMTQKNICQECWTNVPAQNGNVDLSTPELCLTAWILIVMNMIFYEEIDNKTDTDNGYVYTYYNGKDWICIGNEGLNENT
jgi:hypothetical protein